MQKRHLIIEAIFSFLIIGTLWDCALGQTIFETDFEEGNLDGFSEYTAATYAGTVAASTEQAFAGTYSGKVDPTTSNAGMCRLEVLEGAVYKLSARCYVSTGSASDALLFFANNGDCSSSAVGLGSASPTSTGVWQLLEITIASSQSSHRMLLLSINNATVYWDDVKLEKIAATTAHRRGILATYPQ